MNKRPLSFVFMFLIGLFGFIGTIFLTIGLIIHFQTQDFKKSAIKTTATIAKIESYSSNNETHYNVYIDYQFKGTDYYTHINEYSSNMSRGKEITIFINPNDPHKIKTQYSNLLPLIFIIIGAALLVIAVVLVFVLLIRKRRKQNVLETGTVIEAEIDRIQADCSLKFNQQSAYRIYCRWKNPQDDKTYIFKSEHIFYDPTEILKAIGLTKLPVYYDPYNMKRYLVSIN